MRDRYGVTMLLAAGENSQARIIKAFALVYRKSSDLIQQIKSIGEQIKRNSDDKKSQELKESEVLF